MDYKYYKMFILIFKSIKKNRFHSRPIIILVFNFIRSFVRFLTFAMSFCVIAIHRLHYSLTIIFIAFKILFNVLTFVRFWLYLLKIFANIFIFGCGLQPLYLLAFMIFYNLEKWLHLVVAFGYFFHIFPQTFNFGCYL